MSVVESPPQPPPTRSARADGEMLRMLLETSKALNSILDLDPLLEMVMDKVIEISGGQRGFLMLVDQRGELSFKVAKNFQSGLLEGSDFKISRSVVREVARSGRAVCSTNVLEDENIRNRRSVLELGLESVMCAPLVSKQGVIGIVYVDSHRVSTLFDETSLQVFQALADHAAVAIENARLYERAISDEKTGLYNHSHFLRHLGTEMARAERYAEGLSLLMIDLDHFKSVNDRHGHRAGDHALVEVARRLAGSVRAHDLAARYGGEEFAVVVPSGPLKYAPHDPSDLRASFAGALALAERLRRAVADRPVELEDQRSLQLSVSIGVAHYPWPEIETEAQLVEQADQQLYRAKRDGRNLVRSP